MFNMDLTDDKNSYIQSLEKENHYLKYLLDQAGISYHMTKIADSGETLPDSISNSRILPREITEKDAQRFFSMFWGRTDVVQ